MLYAKRDNTGNIIELVRAPTGEATEKITPTDAKVLEFLLEGESDEIRKQFLTITDAELVRVIEDLVELLIQKGLILFTELPEAARNKLITRKQARNAMGDNKSLMVEEDDIL